MKKQQYHATTIRVPIELWDTFQRRKPFHGKSLNAACVHGIMLATNTATTTPPDQIEAALEASLDRLKRVQLEDPSL